MDLFLPPKFSLNSFFVRHRAHPKRMKYISGLNNAKICSVNDIGYIRHDLQYSKPEFPPNNFNEGLIKSDSFTAGTTRREKIVPPNGMWQTFGLIDDTEKWRQQLNSLASAVGLLTQTDIENYQKQKERKQTMQNLQKPMTSQSATRPVTGMCTPLRKPGTASSRYNEPLLTGRKASRQGSRKASRAASMGNITASKHFIVDQSDREAWMLQVLCQILQTENLSDVQSWLVAASDNEKERVKQLIDQAMSGLEQSGRIVDRPEQPMSQQGKPETPKTGTVVIPEAPKKPQSSLAYIENALQKVEINKPNNLYKPSTACKENTKLPNILKLDDDETPQSNEKLSTLDPIYEIPKC